MFLVEAHSRQLSTVAIGVVLAASGVGGLVGSFCSRVMPTVVRDSWLSIQMVVWSVALASLAIAGSQSAYWSALAMFILGLTGAIGNVEFGTYLARSVTDDMIGKITGIGQMLAIGACAVGPVLAGFAIQHFNVQGAIYILFVIVTLLAFASLPMSVVRQRATRRLQAIKELTAGVEQATDANQKTLTLVAAGSPHAVPGIDREGSKKAITAAMPAGPIFLPLTDGRLPSSIDLETIACVEAR
jgi:hypothetical protein